MWVENYFTYYTNLTNGFFTYRSCLLTQFFSELCSPYVSLFSQRTGSYFGGVIWSRLNALLTPVFIKVEGKHNISGNESYVVIPNHQSYFDIFIIYGWLGLDIRWIMKKELERIPGIGFGSKKVGHIFLDRRNKRVAVESLNKAKSILVNGTSVVIFPEGTRSTDGTLGEFKRGAFKLANDLQLPLLPVTINGTGRILPAGTVNLFPGRASMVIHPPIDIKNFTDDNLHELIDYASGIISSRLKADFRH